jgi:signal transduction histidine kinase
VKTHLARTREVLEDSLAQLRRLTASLANGQRPIRRHPALAESLAAEASRLHVVLRLKVAGNDAWLAPQHIDLLLLAGREAIRNVSQHSGTHSCVIELDLDGCPFEMRIHDWGSGLLSGSHPRHGLGLIRQLATESRCSLLVASQPGLGTEVVVRGPACPYGLANRRGGVIAASDEVALPQKDATRRKTDAGQRSNAGHGKQIR